SAVSERSELKESFGLAAELDLFCVCDVEARLMEANVGAEVPGGAWGLAGGVAADDEDRGVVLRVAQGGGAVGLTGECLREGDVVGSAVVVDVVGAEYGAGELLEEVGLFVGESVAADDADRFAAFGVAQLTELLACVMEGLLPGDFLEGAVGLADQGS